MANEKHRLILNQATAVFQKNGYKRVNMRAIAESLNISRPGLYLYFKTKEEIFCAVVREFGSRLVGSASEAASKQDSLRGKLYAAFDAYVVDVFAMTQASPNALEIAESSFEFAREAVDESFQKFEELLISIMSQHRSEFTLRRDISPDRCVRLLVPAVRGYKMVAKHPADLRKMIRQLLQMVLGI